MQASKKTNLTSLTCFFGWVWSGKPRYFLYWQDSKAEPLSDMLNAVENIFQENTYYFFLFVVPYHKKLTHALTLN